MRVFGFELGFGKTGAKDALPPEAPRGETALLISASDVGWTASFSEGSAIRWTDKGWSAIDPSESGTANRCIEAIAKLLADMPDAKADRIALSIDDADIQILDHRFAKLSNFEPRGLKHFGAHQAGGRAVVFGSHPFGLSSAREVERRVLSFLPEDRLEGLFFALGKMAPELAAVVPAPTRGFLGGMESGIFAELRVHGYFSTLALANADNGLIAFRKLGFGAMTLAKAYAAAHGIGLKDSIAALQSRSRLPAAELLSGDPAPEHKTATYAGLAPLLKQLREDIAASLDYFRYERLAGRPAQLALTFTGPEIAGFDTWLAKAAELPIDKLEYVPAASTDKAPLNMLEHCRPGMLKLGNQPFEFSGGRFVAMKEMPAAMPTTPKTPWSRSFPTFAKLAGMRPANAAPQRDALMAGVLAVGLSVLFILGNFNFFVGPADDALSTASTNYTEALSRASAATANSEAQAGQSALWAESLLSIGNSLVPGMTLERVQLAHAAGQGAEQGQNLTILGALPSGSADNLKLVGGYIDRLSKEQSFTRRFGRVRFTGASESKDQARPEMTFGIAATGGAR